MADPNSSNALCGEILEKLLEQTETLTRLIEMVPLDGLNWRPDIAAPANSPGKQSAESVAPANSPNIQPAESVAPVDSPDIQAAKSVYPMTLGSLLGHLLECLAGFCALFYKLSPDRLAHFQQLREKPVNHRCSPDEARDRVREYMSHIEEGFVTLTDEDLTRKVPTIFAPAGESVMTLLLGNLEHLINHKYQLFIYLRLLGVNVGTPDLYKLR